ncbi:MAG TPA: hypothetical protein VFP84_00260, partial [Kofleriaceae bacterium]|nr:hypothetical protein [Kofleriaceae bacterium]
MSNRLAVVVAASSLAIAAAAASCSFGNGNFECKTSDECPAAGVCQPSGFCSVADTTCTPTGQRYGEQSGPMSGKCVADGNPVGGGSDAGATGGSDAGTPPIDASFCFGTTKLATICYAAPPTGDLAITSVTTLNTDTDARCGTPLSGGTGLCVVAAANIGIQSTLRATGSKPLVLLAVNSITSNGDGFINVGSSRTGLTERGAGSDPSTCTTMAGTAPTKTGGGAGGSFAGKGGNGSKSGDNTSTGGVAGEADATAGTKLRGGCLGQTGGGAANGGAAGHGGGVVFLIAGKEINLN